MGRKFLRKFRKKKGTTKGDSSSKNISLFEEIEEVKFKDEAGNPQRIFYDKRKLVIHSDPTTPEKLIDNSEKRASENNMSKDYVKALNNFKNLNNDVEKGEQELIAGRELRK